MLRETNSPHWRGPCPVHEGRNDNFVVEAATGRWYCHSKCKNGGGIIDLEAALGNFDSQTAEEHVLRVIGRMPLGGCESWQRVANYEYLDEQMVPLFRVVRRERRRGSEREKSFFIERFENDNWRKGLKSARLVLYNLANVLSAQQVIVCEGEKDADSLIAWNLTATTCAMGAGKWKQDYSRSLSGKDVVILPDNDEPGRAHARQAARSILRFARSIKIVELPGLALKGDVSDWKEAGGTEDKLLAYIASTSPMSDEGADGLSLDAAVAAESSTLSVFPFVSTEKGLFFRKENHEGKIDQIRLSSPIEVVASTRDSNGENWGRLLRWKDVEGVIHEWVMPMELLAADGAAIRSRLLSGGLPYVTSNSRFRQKLIEYLQEVVVVRQVRIVSRTGWYEQAYVLPDRTYSAEPSIDVIYGAPEGNGTSWKTKGTAEEWSRRVGVLASGNSKLIVATASAFAGPLLSLVGAESGGIHFHGLTSTGKSTALVLASSVCGGGDPAFCQTWRATTNALELVAEAHNDATLFLDELAQVDPLEAANVAYLLGNGQGKVRMTRYLEARPKAHWRILFVSTGEVTLAEHAALSGRPTKGGIEVRVLNLPADAGEGLGMFENLHGSPTPDAFARKIRFEAGQLFGTPFRAFIDRLTSTRGDVRDLLRQVREEFVRRYAPANCSGEIKRAADRLALIAAAGELATEWGLTGWKPEESIHAAARCLQDWINGRSTNGSDLEAAVRQVSRFLEAHGGSRFQDMSRGSTRHLIQNRAGFRRALGPGETQYLVLKEVFKSEVCRGYDLPLVLRELDRRGYLVREDDNMTIKPRLPELGLCRVYCIRSSILEGEE